MSSSISDGFNSDCAGLGKDLMCKTLKGKVGAHTVYVYDISTKTGEWVH